MRRAQRVDRLQAQVTAHAMFDMGDQIARRQGRDGGAGLWPFVQGADRYVIEGNDTPRDRPGRIPAVSITQRFVLAAYVPCDADNPNDAAHAAVRDIKRAIFKDGGSWGHKVSRVSYQGRDIGPRADGRPIVFVTVDIDVDYVEDLTNP